MGLRVDEPRAGGSGNSNDGNTARRAFRSPAEFAACTGVDQELIDRVGSRHGAAGCQLSAQTGHRRSLRVLPPHG